MKKILFTLLASAICLFSFSQNDSIKAESGDWGFTVNVTGLINNVGLSTNKDVVGNSLISTKYFLSNQNAIRVGFGANVNSQTWNLADSVGKALVEVDSSVTQNFFSISPGYERHFLATNRLDPYFSAELPLTVIGRSKTQSTTTTTDATGVSTLQRIIQREGGFGFGVRLGAGFNYFIARKLSLGLEYNFTYQMLIQGGNVSESIIDDPSTGTGNSVFINRTDKQTSNTLNVSNVAVIHLSYFF